MLFRYHKPWFDFQIVWIIAVLLLAGCAPHATPLAGLPADEPLQASSTPEDAAGQGAPIAAGDTAAAPTALPPDTPTAAVPTEAPTAEVTVDPDLPAVFSLPGASQELPENMMEELMFFGGAGGGYDPCENAPQGTLSVPEPDTPVVIFGSASEEKCVVVCGWKPEDAVQITLTAPDSSMIDYPGQVLYGGTVFFCPEFRVDDPLGSYQLRAEGESGEIETRFEVVRPEKPTLTEREGELILYAFAPDEKVRVFAYAPEELGRSQKFAGWQEYRVDEDGKLSIELVGGDELDYFALGVSSGEARYQSPSHGSLICQVDAPSRLQPGMQAQVIDIAGARLYPEGNLVYGTVVEVLSGPGCIDGYRYTWQVAVPDGRTGTIDEAALSPEIETAIIPSEMTCDGAMPTRLNIGMHGRTTFGSKQPLRLYTDAGFSKKIRRELPEGTEFDITHGPSCADHTIWWKVSTADSSAGWTPEGADGEYFIQPWQ